MSWKYLGILCLVTALELIRPTAAWFEQCSHNINLGVGGSMYVNSPSYPNRYPSGSSCRYVIQAPLDYEVNIQCSIAMDKAASACSTEYFYISTDGNQNLTNSEYFCGEGYFQRKSVFRSIAIAYTSSSTTAKGAFSCLVQVNAQPCDCGWSTTSRIVGGTQTQVNEFTFMAAIVNLVTAAILCGGSVILPNSFLTSDQNAIVMEMQYDIGHDQSLTLKTGIDAYSKDVQALDFIDQSQAVSVKVVYMEGGMDHKFWYINLKPSAWFATSTFSGAIEISHRYVLTAAHCFGSVNNPSQLAVVVGEHDLRTGSETPYTKIHLVQSIRRHESYNAATNVNDIALVATQTVIEWSRGVGPACLPFLYSFAPFDGLDVEIMGWGTTSFGGPSSSVLLKAQTTVASNANCQAAVPTLDPSQMCTYSPPRDSCQFDSGGPVSRRFQRLFVVGIISFGRGCGADAPAVNTRVTSHLDWITRNVGETLCRKN